MAGLVKKSFDSPEEVRPFQNGQIQLVNLEGGPVGRATFHPGWHQLPGAHMGYFISGRMKVVMDDGEEADFGPGDFMICPPPGHDAWIVGDETCVVIDWQGVTDYGQTDLTA